MFRGGKKGLREPGKPELESVWKLHLEHNLWKQELEDPKTRGSPLLKYPVLQKIYN